MDRYEIKELGTERRFYVESRAKTLGGLKRACAWIGHGTFYLVYVAGASTELTEELSAWLGSGKCGM
jgi:hypothetical protein